MHCRSIRGVLVCAVASVSVWAQQAHAQVLDQVPADAVAVIKVKSLEGTSKKLAKLAADWGLDQMVPDMKDPLASALEKAHLTNGIDKSGDGAVAFFDPETVKADEANVALIPVSDYKAFVGNFKDAVVTGEITKAKSPDDGAKDVYIAHWGKYAAVSEVQALISKKPAGLKLTGASVKESESRDIIVYSSFEGWRAKAIEQLENARKQAATQIDQNFVDEQQKKYAPLAKLVAEKYIDGAEEFLNDTQSTLVGVTFADDGISTTALANFKPESTLGAYAKRLEGSVGAKLLSGLPARKYFFFGGAKLDPKVTSDFTDKVLGPIIKQMSSQGDEGKHISDLLSSASKSASKVTSITQGMVVPTAGLGEENVFQQIALVHGDAAGLFQAQRSFVSSMSDMFKAVSPGTDLKLTPNAKTIDGVTLDSTKVDVKADGNDPRAAQAQQVLQMLSGPEGMSSSYGVVTPDTLLMSSGANEKLLQEAIAAAKNPQDNLSTLKGVQMVSSHLPKNRMAESYVQLDNIITSAVKYASGFGLPVKVKLPPNLPPIGMAVATEGSSARVDSFIPSTLVQSLISAGIETWTNFQGGGNNAGGPGGL